MIIRTLHQILLNHHRIVHPAAIHIRFFAWVQHSSVRVGLFSWIIIYWMVGGVDGDSFGVNQMHLRTCWMNGWMGGCDGDGFAWVANKDTIIGGSIEGDQ